MLRRRARQCSAPKSAELEIVYSPVPIRCELRVCQPESKDIPMTSYTSGDTTTPALSLLTWPTLGDRSPPLHLRTPPPPAWHPPPNERRPPPPDHPTHHPRTRLQNRSHEGVYYGRGPSPTRSGVQVSSGASQPASTTAAQAHTSSHLPPHLKSSSSGCSVACAWPPAACVLGGMGGRRGQRWRRMRWVLLQTHWKPQWGKGWWRELR